jgi:hypothetical protein
MEVGICLLICIVFVTLCRYYRALYEDGVLIPSKKGQSADPKPTAGNDGTTITVGLETLTVLTDPRLLI